MGFVYALIAAGLSLIFGLMEIVNFAHGEFLMLAMFATFWAWALWRLDPLVSLPLTAAALFLLGFAIYHGLIRWILGAPMLAQIFATFGLAIFLRSAAQALWGVDFQLVKDPLVQGRISLGGLVHRPAAARGQRGRAPGLRLPLLVHQPDGDGARAAGDGPGSAGRLAHGHRHAADVRARLGHRRGLRGRRRARS